MHTISVRMCSLTRVYEGEMLMLEDPIAQKKKNEKAILV